MSSKDLTDVDRAPAGADVTEEEETVTDAELAWLNNGFDEEAMSRGYDEAFRDGVEASPTPKHWRPVEIDET